MSHGFEDELLRCCVCFWYWFGLICCKLSQPTRDNNNLYNNLKNAFLSSVSVFFAIVERTCLLVYRWQRLRIIPNRAHAGLVRTFFLLFPLLHWRTVLAHKPENLPRAWIYVWPIRAGAAPRASVQMLKAPNPKDMSETTGAMDWFIFLIRDNSC